MTTFYNTSFGILICILAVVLCTTYGLLKGDNYFLMFEWTITYKSIVSFSIYVLCVFFVHTLLMVLKRLNKILLDDFE